MVAAAVYQLAMRDAMPPRFTAADMPPRPAPVGSGAQPAAQAEGTPAQPAAGSGEAQKESAPVTPKK